MVNLVETSGVGDSSKTPGLSDEKSKTVWVDQNIKVDTVLECGSDDDDDENISEGGGSSNGKISDE